MRRARINTRVAHAARLIAPKSPCLILLAIKSDAFDFRDICWDRQLWAFYTSVSLKSRHECEPRMRLIDVAKIRISHICNLTDYSANSAWNSIKALGALILLSPENGNLRVRINSLYCNTTRGQRRWEENGSLCFSVHQHKNITSSFPSSYLQNSIFSIFFLSMCI